MNVWPAGTGQWGGKGCDDSCLSQTLLSISLGWASCAFDTGQSEPGLIHLSSARACGGRGPVGQSRSVLGQARSWL